MKTPAKAKYERIKKTLVNQLGTPTTADTKAKEVEDEGEKYLVRDTNWESENVSATLNMIFEAQTYRIRLTIYWKK